MVERANKNDSRGSLWRRWDLHVHTPASFTHGYGGDDDAAWERFIADLEALPEDIAVLGINDYLFLDGYSRLRAARESGRLPKIQLLLPVIELRLDKFGGTSGALSRVNFHVIFSDELRPEQIQEQFLNLLVHHYVIGPGNEWRAAPTRESLEDLGRRIIESVPRAERGRFRSALSEGFHNLNLPLILVRQALNNSFLAGKHFTAVGKTEWWDIKWNDQSIAEKRNIIEGADFVFVAAANEEHCIKAQTSLRTSGVNDRLLDCSDAHYPSDSKQKDRIGQTFTWIKADPTFEGLRQALRAPDDRVFLGRRPDKLRLLAENPTKFIKSLRIGRKASATLSEKWFDNYVEFGHDLVAIIGNKGMGKSALADIVALTSNTDVPQESFGFLREKRFKDRSDNKAKHFAASITWYSGVPLERGLDESVPSGAVPQVRYIPQNFFESLCNETSDPSLLQGELRKVIFSNLSDAQKRQFSTLDDLIKDRTAEANRKIDGLRGELLTVNRKIVASERDLAATRRKEVESALQLKEAELAAVLASEPEVVEAAEVGDSTPVLESSRLAVEALDQKIVQARSGVQDALSSEAAVGDLLSRFRELAEAVARIRAETAGDLARLGLTFESIVTLEIQLGPLEALEAAASEESRRLELSIEGPEGLVSQRAIAGEGLKVLQESLNAPALAHQRYLDARASWEQQQREILGASDRPETVEFLRAWLGAGLEVRRVRLRELLAERRRISRSIHEELASITRFLRTLYAGVERRLSLHAEIQSQLNVNFFAKLVDSGLAAKFTAMINRARAGAFSDEHAMRDMLAEVDVGDPSVMEAFLESTLERLQRNASGEPGDIDDVRRQMRGDSDPERLYNFLFGLEYLVPSYSLRVNQREVSLLTPGERGSLLLVFYLLIDQDERPLVIDQPEENLDNQSVYELLVPCMKIAKARRQLIVVTHNPNLAVVCNAEQVIFCRIDKQTDFGVVYESGGLESPVINKHVVDVLEGTWPAFDDRGGKYDPNQAKVRLVGVD